MSELIVYGAPWCPDCRRAKKFLDEHRVAYRYVNIDLDADGLAYVERLQNGGRTIPTIAFPDGSHLLEPGNDELAGKLGLSLAAERETYDLVIIGNSALEEGLFLAQFAARIRVVTRDGLTASKLVQDKVRGDQQFTLHLNTDIESFTGTGGKLTEVRARDRATGEEHHWHPSAAFVFIGLDPNTDWLSGLVELDRWGFVRTDDTFATSVPGVFAAGDVRAGATKQLGAATGDGIAALIAIRSYLQRRSAVPLIDVNA